MATSRRAAAAPRFDADAGLDAFEAAFPPLERTLPLMLIRQASRFPQRTLIKCGEIVWTYARALEIAGGMAARFAEAGVKRGDRVAIVCSNGPAILQAILGCAWGGFVAAPINMAARGAQLELMLRNCGAELVIAEAERLPQLIVAQAHGAPFGRVWTVGESDVALPSAFITAMPEPALPTRAQSVRLGDTAAILYTSGTTGPAKGVACPHAQMFWWAAHAAALLGLREGERLLTMSPLFHMQGLSAFYQAILTGSTLIVEKRFSAPDFLPSLRRHDASATYLFGAMVPLLLQRSDSPKEREHFVRVALAPGLQPEHREAFTRRFGIALVDGYGSTESNFVIGDRPDALRPGAMGRLRPGFEAAVLDPEDNPLPDGVAGELALRAHEPFAFSTGYFGMPDRTVQTWRNFWLHTGDRVVRDADGRFRFLDRVKDEIHRGGETVSTFEIEQAILAHPAVSQVAAFPVRSQFGDDEVMATIVLKGGANLDPIELIDHCASRLPDVAVPRFLNFVDALPVTETGKVRKGRLSEQGVTAMTFDAVAAGFKRGAHV